jgi:hypothetical protein
LWGHETNGNHTDASFIFGVLSDLDLGPQMPCRAQQCGISQTNRSNQEKW